MRVLGPGDGLKGICGADGSQKLSQSDAKQCAVGDAQWQRANRDETYNCELHRMPNPPDRKNRPGVG